MILVTEEFDAYIIVSFVNATLVLSIGETVEEVTDSGFLGTTPTLSCSALGEDALVQVIQICNNFNDTHCGISDTWINPTYRSQNSAKSNWAFASLVCLHFPRVLLVIKPKQFEYQKLIFFSDY